MKNQVKPNWIRVRREKAMRAAVEEALSLKPSTPQPDGNVEIPVKKKTKTSKLCPRPSPLSSTQPSTNVPQAPSTELSRTSSKHDSDSAIDDAGGELEASSSAGRDARAVVGDVSNSPAKVFAPETDNLLLRSLLYDETYTYIAPPNRPPLLATGGGGANGGAGAGGSGQAKAAAQGERGATSTGTRTSGPCNGSGANAGEGTARGEVASSNGSGANAGAGTARGEVGAMGTPRGEGAGTSAGLFPYPVLSPRAGRRPAMLGPPDGPRLGPAFGSSYPASRAPGGPGGALDGTAATFGNRATGSFRAGLAASMVAVGLVPPAVASAAAGETQIIENTEAAVAKHYAEVRPQFATSAARSAGGNPEGVAGGGIGMSGQTELTGPSNGKGPPRLEDGRDGSWKGKGKGSESRAVDTQRSLPAGGGGNSGGESMDVENTEDEEGDKKSEPWMVKPRNVRRGHWVSDEREATTIASAAAAAPPSPQPTNQYRRWNLKHMKVMMDDGSRSDVCCSCRMHPGGAAMVCPSAELSRMHVFCFPCLAKKESIQKSQLITGRVKVGR